MQQVDKLEAQRLGQLRDQAAKGMVTRLSGMGGGMGQPAAAAPPEEKQIIKEGVSEYFVFTIDGTETIRNGWSKRMRAIRAAGVPLKIQYRYREPEYGPQLVRMYLMTNNVASKLGNAPLPDGTVRVFRDNGRGGLSYLAQQPTKYVPIGDKFELNLGPDPEVVFQLIKTRAWRDNIWMQLDGGNVLRRVDDGAVKIDVAAHVAGWDDHELFTQRVRNYTDKPIEVEVRRAFPGHAVFRSRLAPTLHDYQTVQYAKSVAAGEKAELTYEVLHHQGRNAKQNNVSLESADVGR
jgi:hypothetical protein